MIVNNIRYQDEDLARKCARLEFAIVDIGNLISVFVSVKDI